MMRFIVAQKYRHLSRLVVACCAILALSGNVLSVNGAEVRSANKTFADWCRQKAALSPETKHTVEVVLKEVGTTDCDEADRNLSSRQMLNLSDNQISDTKPLTSLTNLTWLNLNNNQISDIKPFESLTNLGQLVLSNNQISDIKPLESLTNMMFLFLSNNRISDIKPLVPLTNLAWIFLANNQISDIKPLESLTNLKNLVLNGNPIALKTCPLKRESICKWELPKLGI